MTCRGPTPDYPRLTPDYTILILESGLGYGAYGLYGCSESGTACTTTGTGPAVHNAVGKWIDDYPITPDRILKALGKI